MGLALLRVGYWRLALIVASQMALLHFIEFISFAILASVRILLLLLLMMMLMLMLMLMMMMMMMLLQPLLLWYGCCCYSHPLFFASRASKLVFRLFSSLLGLG